MALVQPDYERNVRFIPLGSKAFVAPRFTQPKKPNFRCMVRMYADAYAVLGPGDIMLAGGAVCDTLTTMVNWMLFTTESASNGSRRTGRRVS